MKSISIALLFATACSSAGTGTVEELRQALPTRKLVSITPAITQTAAVSTCATLGASTFGSLTHQIASGADGVLGDVLGVVGSITSNPPSAAQPGRAVWGPITSPNGSIYQLQVEEAAPHEFHFVLAGRDAGSNFRGIFQGVTLTPDATHRAGHVAVDFDVMHALDPSVNPPTGGLQIDFAADDPARQLTAQFPDAQYHLETDAAQNTALKYIRNVDFDNNGVADELAQIESRWSPTGSGAAHLAVTGGSLGTRTVNAMECWDPTLNRVFYTDDSAAPAHQGDPACCP